MSMFFSHRGVTYREVIEARLAFEPMQARLAAERLTDEAAQLVHEAAETGWQSLDAPDDVWVDGSRAFHQTIAQISCNRVLELWMGGMLAVEASYLAHAVKREFRPHTLHAHDKIVTAIVQRDGARAEELSREHMQVLVRDIERAYADEMGHVIDWLNLD
jgi:DNA-binding FadR family transcriptional regulator